MPNSSMSALENASMKASMRVKQWKVWKSRLVVLSDDKLSIYKGSGKSKSLEKEYDLKRVTFSRKRGSEIIALQRVNRSNVLLEAKSSKEAKLWYNTLKKLTASSSTSNSTGFDVGVADYSSAAVCANDTGVIVDVNTPITELFGFSRDELIGKNVTVLMPDSLKPQHAGFLDRYKQGGVRKLMGKPRKVIGRHKNGDLVPVLICLSEMTSGDNCYFIATFHPASENVALDLEKVPQPAVLTNETVVIQSCNKAFLKLFGYTEKEVVGQNVTMLMNPHLAKMHAMYVERYLLTGVSELLGKQRKVVAMKKGGKPITVSIMLNEIISDAGSRNFFATFMEHGDFSDDLLNQLENSSDGDTASDADDDNSSTGRLSLHSTSTSTTASTSVRFRSSVAGDKGSSAINTPAVAKTEQRLHQFVTAELQKLENELSRTQKENDSLRRGATGSSMVSAPSSGNNVENVVIREKIFSGANTSVFVCTINGWMCCMKELDIGVSSTSSLDSFDNEIRLVENLPYHENVVRYLCHQRLQNKLRLFMTRYDASLSDVISKVKGKRGRFPAKEIASFLTQIIAGVNVLHQNGFLHRDLKTDNVFVVLGENGVVKTLAIGDFDSAKQYGKATTLVGTPGYIAPEVMIGGGGGYGEGADIYSIGMIAYELITLERPFANVKSIFELSKLTLEGKKPPIPDSLESAYAPLVDLYDKCTHQNPERRPSLNTLAQMLAGCQL